MKIHCLIVHDGDPDEAWLMEARDEISIDINDSEWEQQLRKAASYKGHAEVIVEVPRDFLQAPFNPPSVKGEVINR